MGYDREQANRDLASLWGRLARLPEGEYKIKIIEAAYISMVFDGDGFVIVKAKLEDGLEVFLMLPEKGLPCGSRDNVKPGMEFTIKVMPVYRHMDISYVI
jgi:hypothetical protein